MKFGGMGGISGGRPLDITDQFEIAVNQVLGDRIRTDDDICVQMWSALANQNWYHDDGDTASYSFRAAGDLIAAIRGHGDYLDWYCSGEFEEVSDTIRDALATVGWHPKLVDQETGEIDIVLYQAIKDADEPK